MTGPTPGWCLWITGRPAAGKTTLGRALQTRLAPLGDRALLLDSDALRPILTPGAGYSVDERERFYRGLAALAALLVREGGHVIVAATAPRRHHRDVARTQIDRFAEIYVRCSLERAAARDPKGLYARATAGEIVALPGLGTPYEPPLNPELVVDSERHPVAELVEQTLTALPWLRDSCPQRELW